MPIDYVIHTHAQIVTTRFRGQVRFHDIVEHTAKLQQDPGFKPEYSEIVDLTNAEDFRMDFSETSIVAQYIDPFLPDSKRAIVATTAANIGSARMHQMLRRDLTTCHVFKCFEDAWEWVSPKQSPVQKHSVHEMPGVGPATES